MARTSNPSFRDFSCPVKLHTFTRTTQSADAIRAGSTGPNVGLSADYGVCKVDYVRHRVVYERLIPGKHHLTSMDDRRHRYVREMGFGNSLWFAEPENYLI